MARSDPFFANSSATLGSSFSDYQLGQLQLFEEVVLVPDNDDAGEEMKHTLFRLLRSRAVKVLRIADRSIKDADEIPGMTGLSVEEFRLQGGFRFEEILSF